jgi:ankyrin repeat protein
MSLEDIYKKYYSKDVPNLATFKEINAANPDFMPDKKGKYLDWLVRKAYKSNPDLFIEDFDKIQEDLELFDKYQSKIGKQITQIKDHYELSKLVQQFRKKKDAGEIDLSRSEIKKDVEKIYEDSNWLLIHPKTKEAAKYYGANTRWCTAADKDNMFDWYNAKGPLYILINKKVPSEKYQLHFQTDQYMDSEDAPIDFDTTVLPTIIYDKLVEEAFKNNGGIQFITDLSSSLQPRYEKLYSKQYDSHKLGRELVDLLNDNTSNIDEIRDIINKGADVNVNKGAPLKIAAEEGKLDIVKTLVEKGAIINNPSNSALVAAIFFNRFDIIKYLIEECKADVNINDSSPLDAAVSTENINIVKYLVEHGANINNNELGILNLAASNNNFEIVKYLVEKGADINSPGGSAQDTPLYFAANRGNLDMVKYLIEKGATVDDDPDAIFYAKTPEIKKYLQDIRDKKNNKRVDTISKMLKDAGI